MRAIRLLSAVSLVCAAAFAANACADAVKGATVSPHADALELVFARAADKIRALDGDAPWLDTKERVWSVKRPFGPGGFDSTHWFDVVYSIDGHVVAKWSVDTRNQTVSESPLAAKASP
jgi:hypothetical protein